MRHPNDKRSERASPKDIVVGLALAALGLVLAYALSHWIVHGWLFEGLRPPSFTRAPTGDIGALCNSVGMALARRIAE